MTKFYAEDMTGTGDECLPMEYRKFYDDLPEQITPRRSPRKPKEILSSPATVSTMASSVVSSLTPPFVSDDEARSMPPVPFPPRAVCATMTSSSPGSSDCDTGTFGTKAALTESGQILHRIHSNMSVLLRAFISFFSQAGRRSRHQKVTNGKPQQLMDLQRELTETKEALRKLEVKIGRGDVDDMLSTTSTEAVSGGEILHASDPWNDSIRSFVSFGTNEFVSIPDEVSIVSRAATVSSVEAEVLRAQLEKNERHTKLLEAKLRASEAVASTLFKSLTDIRVKQRELDRLNKDRASCEDIELMLHHTVLLRVTGPLALLFLASGHVELFAAVVVVLFFSLEVVSDS